MLIDLPLSLASVAAVAWRLGNAAGGRRMVFLIAALALAVRLIATEAVSIIAMRVHVTALWLNDEASFFLATQALLPNPLDKALPLGLDHLGGDGYLGLITVLSMLGGNIADANAFRVVNSALGTLMVVLGMLMARRLFGDRAALVAGIGLALWPTLVLWSATMLRDTMGGFAVVAVWWTLGHARSLGRVRTAGTVGLALVIVLSLRPYLGGAMAVGVFVWAAYPYLKGLHARGLVAIGAAVVVLAVASGIVLGKRLDYAAHELIYRQTVTRMETLGKLYVDEPPATDDKPMRPGTAVGITQSDGWVLGGIVQDFPTPDVAHVAFTDESTREVPTSELVRLQSTNLPPLELVAWIGPNLVGYLAGATMTSEPNNPASVVMALIWDVLLVLAAIGIVRRRVSPSEWLFPACVVGGTMLALVAIPGAPGNAERHRATQTVPLLVVFATALVADWDLVFRRSGFAVASIKMRPASEAGPASSRMRSAR